MTTGLFYPVVINHWGVENSMDQKGKKNVYLKEAVFQTVVAKCPEYHKKTMIKISFTDQKMMKDGLQDS